MRSTKVTKYATVALASALLTAAPISQAATTTTTMLVTATVLSTCVAVATPVIFGDYVGLPLDNTGLITVTCTPDVNTYTVGLNKGTGTGATTSTRKMTPLVALTAAPLGYGLFRDSARTQNWGDVSGDWQPASAATSDAGIIKTFTVFGRLNAGQYGAIGLYADTITVTVTY